MFYSKMHDLADKIHCFLKAEGRWPEAEEIALRAGVWNRKAAVAGTGSADLRGDFAHVLEGEFLQFLEENPVGFFDQIRPMTRQSEFRVPMFLPIAPLVAEVVPEGVSIPVVKYAIDGGGLVPQKVGGIAVLTKESLKTESGARALIGELQAAVSLATDRAVIAALAADVGTTESATADPLADLKRLLDGVNLTGFGKLAWALSPETVNFLCTLRSGEGGPLLFPDLGPQGGSLLGVPANVTRALTDSLLLCDGMAMVTASGSLEIKMTQQAMVEMDSAPAMEGNTPTSPTGEYVSMFQTDCMAILGIRSFGCKLVRPSGCAVLEGLEAWGIPGESS